MKDDGELSSFIAHRSRECSSERIARSTDLGCILIATND
jgi:hypothetical protein